MQNQNKTTQTWFLSSFVKDVWLKLLVDITLNPTFKTRLKHTYLS